MKLTANLRMTTLAALCALALSPAVLFAANAPKTHEARGAIKSVDADAHTLVVSDLKDKSEHKFQWNDQTKFSERGKAVTATELKAGERVRITYAPGGDRPTMQRVHIAPAKAEKSTTEKS